MFKSYFKIFRNKQALSGLQLTIDPSMERNEIRRVHEVQV